MISATTLTHPAFASRFALAMLQAAKWANYARPRPGRSLIRNRYGRIAVAVFATRATFNGPIEWVFEDNDGHDITAQVFKALPNYAGPLPSFKWGA